jgi:phage shock protein A
MFGTFITLVKGMANRQALAAVDDPALIILEQQIRAAEREVASARKAVASAIAHNQAEKRFRQILTARIAELKSRAIAALSKDDFGIATEAAEAIARLDGERDASETAQASFCEEIDCMKLVINRAEMKLFELKRGQWIAEAADEEQRLRIVFDTAPDGGLSGLREAEETLLRLRSRQKHLEDASAALTMLETETTPSRLAEKMAGLGYGDPVISSAAEVLQRLRAKAAANSA